MQTFHEQALEGQHIVISGGLGALGLAVVKGLVDHGARMTINDLLEERDAYERLAAAGVRRDRVAYLKGDMTDEGEVAAFIAHARDRFGPVHTALCHVGMVLSVPLIEVTGEAWDRVMAVNVKTAFLLAKTAANAMIADQVAGHLLFTISWVAETPWPDIGAYNTSKAAMRQLMRSFARELAARRIRANAIAPGIAEVGMAKRQWDTEPDYRARVSRAIPLGYMQPPASIVDAFLFMCSAAASYMTGSVLLVDGGCSLYPMD